MKRLLYVLILCIVTANCEAQTFKPTLNLVKGGIYYLSANAGSVVVQTVGGQQNTVNIVFNSRMAFKVINITDTVYDMEVNYQSLSAKMDLAGIDIDSKKNDLQDTVSTVLAAMMNRPFEVEITKTGKVKAIKNVDAVINGALSRFPKIEAAQKEQLRAMFMELFGPVVLRGSIETGTAIFPDASVAKEGKWTVVTRLESPAKTIVSISYRLTDIAAGLYLIRGDGTITTDKDAPAQQINGMPVKYSLTGSVISDIRADKATGWITEIKIKRVMMGDMQILDNPKIPGGMRIPISFNTDVVTTNK